MAQDAVPQCTNHWGFPGGALLKNLPADTGDARAEGSNPGSGRSPGGGNGNPLQYSHLEKFHRQRGVWCATVHGAMKSRTWLSIHTAPMAKVQLKEKQ